MRCHDIHYSSAYKNNDLNFVFKEVHFENNPEKKRELIEKIFKGKEPFMHLPSVYSDEQFFQTENYQNVRKTSSIYETHDHLMYTPTFSSNNIQRTPSSSTTRLPLVVLEKNGSFYKAPNSTSSSSLPQQSQTNNASSHTNFKPSINHHQNTTKYYDSSSSSHSVAHLDRIMNDIVQHESYDNHPTMTIANTDVQLKPTESFTYHSVPDAKLPVYWVSEVPKDKVDLHLKG